MATKALLVWRALVGQVRTTTPFSLSCETLDSAVLTFGQTEGRRCAYHTVLFEPRNGS